MSLAVPCTKIPTAFSVSFELLPARKRSILWPNGGPHLLLVQQTMLLGGGRVGEIRLLGVWRELYARGLPGQLHQEGDLQVCEDQLLRPDGLGQKP
jgi:hypothetical protein